MQVYLCSQNSVFFFFLKSYQDYIIKQESAGQHMRALYRVDREQTGSKVPVCAAHLSDNVRCHICTKTTKCLQKAKKKRLLSAKTRLFFTESKSDMTKRQKVKVTVFAGHLSDKVRCCHICTKTTKCLQKVKKDF